MVTPFRVVIVALALGIGTAIVISMQAPPLPPEDAATPASDLSSSSPPAPAQSASPSLVQGPTSQPAFKLAPGPVTKTASGLTIVEVKEGSGLAAKAGDNIEVQYIGRLYDTGVQFDNSYDRGRPLAATLAPGRAGLIAGFTEGMIGMKVGGKRQLIIPSNLGYGAKGVPRANIPPNATLVFDVELMSISPAQ